MRWRGPASYTSSEVMALCTKGTSYTEVSSATACSCVGPIRIPATATSWTTSGVARSNRSKVGFVSCLLGSSRISQAFPSTTSRPRRLCGTRSTSCRVNPGLTRIFSRPRAHPLARAPAPLHRTVGAAHLFLPHVLMIFTKSCKCAIFRDRYG